MRGESTLSQSVHQLSGAGHFALREQTYSLRDSGREIGMVTVSLGVAQYGAGEPAMAVIERADAAPYCAKSDGQDRVVAEANGSV